MPKVPPSLPLSNTVQRVALAHVVVAVVLVSDGKPPYNGHDAHVSWPGPFLSRAPRWSGKHDNMTLCPNLSAMLGDIHVDFLYAQLCPMPAVTGGRQLSSCSLTTLVHSTPKGEDA